MQEYNKRTNKTKRMSRQKVGVQDSKKASEETRSANAASIAARSAAKAASLAAKVVELAAKAAGAKEKNNMEYRNGNGNGDLKTRMNTMEKDNTALLSLLNNTINKLDNAIEKLRDFKSTVDLYEDRLSRIEETIREKFSEAKDARDSIKEALQEDWSAKMENIKDLIENLEKKTKETKNEDETGFSWISLKWYIWCLSIGATFMAGLFTRGAGLKQLFIDIFNIISP